MASGFSRLWELKDDWRRGEEPVHQLSQEVLTRGRGALAVSNLPPGTDFPDSRLETVFRCGRRSKFESIQVPQHTRFCGTVRD